MQGLSQILPKFTIKQLISFSKYHQYPATKQQKRQLRSTDISSNRNCNYGNKKLAPSLHRNNSSLKQMQRMKLFNISSPFYKRERRDNSNSKSKYFDQCRPNFRKSDHLCNKSHQHTQNQYNYNQFLKKGKLNKLYLHKCNYSKAKRSFHESTQHKAQSSPLEKVKVKFIYKPFAKKCYPSCGLFKIKCCNCCSKLDSFNRQFQEHLRKRGLWKLGLGNGRQDQISQEFQGEIKNTITFKLVDKYLSILKQSEDTINEQIQQKLNEQIALQIPQQNPPNSPQTQTQTHAKLSQILHLTKQFQVTSTDLHNMLNKTSSTLMKQLQQYINSLNVGIQSKLSLFDWSQKIDDVFKKQVIDRHRNGIRGSGIGLDLGENGREELLRDGVERARRITQNITNIGSQGKQNQKKSIFGRGRNKRIGKRIIILDQNNSALKAWQNHQNTAQQQYTNTLSQYNSQQNTKQQNTKSNKNANTHTNTLKNTNTKNSKNYKTPLASKSDIKMKTNEFVSIRTYKQIKSGMLDIDNELNQEQEEEQDKMTSIKKIIEQNQNQKKHFNKKLSNRRTSGGRENTGQNHNHNHNHNQNHTWHKSGQNAAKKTVKNLGTIKKLDSQVPNSEIKQFVYSIPQPLDFPDEFQTLCGEYRVKVDQKPKRRRRMGIILKNLNINAQAEEFKKFKKQVKKNHKLKMKVQKCLKDIGCKQLVLSNLQPTLNHMRKAHLLESLIDQNKKQLKKALKYYINIHRRNRGLKLKKVTPQQYNDQPLFPPSAQDQPQNQQHNSPQQYQYQQQNFNTFNQFIANNYKKYIQNEKFYFYNLNEYDAVDDINQFSGKCENGNRKFSRNFGRQFVLETVHVHVHDNVHDNVQDNVNARRNFNNVKAVQLGQEVRIYGELQQKDI